MPDGLFEEAGAPLRGEFMNVFLGILIMLLILSILTVIHEWGHFIAARIFKVKVEEFSIFMGPKLFARRSKKTGTQFTLRLLPIGGYCAFADDNGDTESKDSLSTQKWYKRAVIYAAGVIMNIILAWVICIAIVGSGNFFTNTVREIKPDSTAAFVGLETGDKIVKAGGLRVVTGTDFSLATYGIKDVNPADDVMDSAYTLFYKKASDGRTVRYDVKKNIQYKEAENEKGEKSYTYDTYSYNITVTDGDKTTVYDWFVKVNSISEEGNSANCTVTKTVDGERLSEETYDMPAEAFCTLGNNDLMPVNSKNVFAVIGSGFNEMVSMVKSVYVSIWWLITGKVGFDSLAGPVGLTKVVSDVVAAKAKTGLKFITLLNLSALISANLGVINALPFPGLDGFHLLLIVIELLRGGKKVSPKVQNIISYVGLALLIILAIAVAGMDIFKLVR